MERVTRAFLFHEALATQDEGASLEEALEHVFWYYPSTASQRERVKHVGLAQALLSFSSRFNQRADDDAATTDRQTGISAEGRTEPGGVEMVRTRYHSHGFFRCEPGVWLVMVVRNRPKPSRTNERDQEGPTSSATAGTTFSPPSNSNKQASTPVRRFRAAIFGRTSLASSQGSSTAGRASPSSTQSAGSGNGRSSPDGQNRNSSPNGTRTRGDGGGRGGGGGSGGDWVDESSLRAAMATAYETFALLHGPIQQALDAPIRVHDTGNVPGCSSDYCRRRRRPTTAATVAGSPTVNTSQAAPVDAADAAQASAGVVVSGDNAAERRVVGVGDGDGGGDGDRGRQGRGREDQEGIGEGGIGSEISVPGGEVLRRLASARKRLRMAKRDVSEAPVVQDTSADGGTPEQQPETEIPAVENAIVENSDPSPELERLERLVRTAEHEIASLLPLSPAEKLRETLSAFFQVYLPRAGLGQPHFHLDMGYPQSLPMDLYRQQLGLRMQRRLHDRIRAACRSRHRRRRTDRRGAKVCADSVSILLSIAGGALLLTCAGREPAPGDDNAQAGVSAGRTTTELFDGRTVSSSGSGALPRNDVRNGGENCGVEVHQSDGFFGGKEASLLLGYLSAVASSAAAAVSGTTAVNAEVSGGGELSSSGAVSHGDGVGTPSGESTVRPHNGEAVCEDAAGGRGGSRAALTEEEGAVTKSPTLPSRQTPRRSWNPWRDGDNSNSTAGDKNSFPPATNNGNYCNSHDNAGVSSREEGVNGNGRSGRGESWMSRGESGGLLCWDGGVVACGTTKNSSIGARGGSGGDVGGEGCDDDCGRELMDYGIWSPRLHSPRAGRNRRVVVYLRGGLCAVLAFEEEPEGSDKDVAHAPDAAEVSARNDEEKEEEGGGLSGKEVPDEGVDQSELLALGDILEACLAEDPDLAVLEDDALDLYTQTVAAPTPSPTPSSWSGDGVGASEGASSAGFGGFRGATGRNSKPSSGFSRPQPPLRAVRFSPLPVSCFSGAGLVYPPTPDPPAPPRPSAATVPRSLSHHPPSFPSSSAARSPYTSGGEIVVVSGGSRTVSGRLSSPSCASPGGDNRGSGGGSCVGDVRSFPPSPTFREGEPSGNDETGCGRSSMDGIGCGRSRGMVCSACGGGVANDGRCRDVFLRVGAAGLQERGGGFRALIEAFARRGRADIGVEKLRRRTGEGGEQQLAALDDFHASLRDPAHPAQDRYARKISKNGSQEVMCDGDDDGGGGGDGDGSGGMEGNGTVSGVVLKGGSADVHTTKRTCEFDGRAALFRQQQHKRVQEIGLRTSMSKGNRWVIGSRVPRKTGVKYAGVVDVNPTTVMQGNNHIDLGRAMADIGNDGTGELHVVVEAPILSVGDARAAAERLFLQGGDGSGGAGAGGANGRGSAGVVRSSSRTITSQLRC